MGKSWQQSLLGSGLPLENDVSSYLQSVGCLPHFHYSYLKADELTIEREFSYDIDAALILGGHFFELMIECKYRHQSANWVFAPDSYGGYGELDVTDVAHPVDDFVPQFYPYRERYTRPLAPLCSTGVEILADGSNEKTVTQAVSQLAYAHAGKVVSAIEHQVGNLLGRPHIFYHVPVVCTTAPLWRLREGVRISDIKQASDLAEVASREPCVVLRHVAGADLYRHNARILQGARARLGDKQLRKSLCSHTKDLNHLFSLYARDSPKAVVVVEWTEDHAGFERLLQYLRNLIKPPADVLAEMEAREKEVQELAAAIEADRRSRKAATRGGST